MKQGEVKRADEAQAAGGEARGPVPMDGRIVERNVAQTNALMRSLGGGRPLRDDTRMRMERALGADFSAVRIHEGSQAKAAGARAFTEGTEIHFAPGAYDPAGDELLAHELAHVVQQAQGRVQPTAQVGGAPVNADGGLEREAHDKGAAAARGEVASGPRMPIAAATGVMQREVERAEAGYVSTLDPTRTIYPEHRTAESLDRTLQYLDELRAGLAGGVGRMAPEHRARLARLALARPSWIGDEWPNATVQARVRELVETKRTKEAAWRRAATPHQCRDALLAEGYPEAGEVFRSWETTTGGMQAGYAHQLRAHITELCEWRLERIEPHYIGSQGDTHRRGDSLLITAGTQEPHSQFYSPSHEDQRAELVDHKLGYRGDKAPLLGPSVAHASAAMPVMLGDRALPTSMRFQWPGAAPPEATQVIAEHGASARESRPSAFPGGLSVGGSSVLPPAHASDVLKRQVGCAGKSDRETADRIFAVVTNYLLDQGVWTQPGIALDRCADLLQWFDILARDVRAWLSERQIYEICRKV